MFPILDKEIWYYIIQNKKIFKIFSISSLIIFIYLSIIHVNFIWPSFWTLVFINLFFLFVCKFSLKLEWKYFYNIFIFTFLFIYCHNPNDFWTFWRLFTFIITFIVLAYMIKLIFALYKYFLTWQFIFDWLDELWKDSPKKEKIYKEKIIPVKNTKKEKIITEKRILTEREKWEIKEQEKREKEERERIALVKQRMRTKWTKIFSRIKWKWVCNCWNVWKMSCNRCWKISERTKRKWKCSCWWTIDKIVCNSCKKTMYL